MIFEVIEVFSDLKIEQTISMNGMGVAVIIPTTDLGMGIQAARRASHMANLDHRMVLAYDQSRIGFIKTINLATQALRPEFVAYLAQDALAGKDWLRIAIEDGLMRQRKSLFAFNDGKFGGTLASFGAVRAAFSALLYGDGILFCGEYHSHRADEELTWLAHLTDQLVYDPRATVLEVDYRLHREIREADLATYRRRKPQFDSWANTIKMHLANAPWATGDVNTSSSSGCDSNEKHNEIR